MGKGVERGRGRPVEKRDGKFIVLWKKRENEKLGSSDFFSRGPREVEKERTQY